MGRKRILTVEAVETAMQAVGGIKTAAAISLGVHRSTLYNFLELHPECKTFIMDIEEQTKDMAEGQILKAIKAGDMQTVRWYADRLMRERGYGHNTELTGPNRGPIQVQPTIDASKLSTEALRELRNAAVAAYADAEANVE